MTTIGILGTGHLAAFLVTGAMRAPGLRFVVSPRGAETAAKLAATYGVEVAASNQAVVDAADRVLVCLPARQGLEILRGLRFREGQSVLSAMAGASPVAVAGAVAPALGFATMMPGHANAQGAGPCLLHPPSPEWRAFLERLGPVHVFDEAAAFERACVFGALSGASFFLMQRMIDWFVAQGVDPATARALVAGTLRGNAEVLLTEEIALDDLIPGIATPGGITEQLVGVLDERGGFAAWEAGLDAVRDRMLG